ncbi:MAG: hypothetical protein J7L61_03950 [Thermoplasmata archaeon]|nr:hypothetical protein [Thermoplasmata archaeon]
MTPQEWTGPVDGPQGGWSPPPEGEKEQTQGWQQPGAPSPAQPTAPAWGGGQQWHQPRPRYGAQFNLDVKTLNMGILLGASWSS